MGQKEETVAERDNGNFIVREKKTVWGVGILIIALGIFLLVLELKYHIKDIPVWIYLVILAITGSGAAVCMSGKNRKLKFTGDGHSPGNFCYTGFTGKSREFAFDDIGYVKAAFDTAKGQDYIIIYNKKGEKLCKLENNMHNAFFLLLFLHDSGIRMETPDSSTNLLSEFVTQERIAEENIREEAEKAYRETESVISAWLEKNGRTGAELYYGLAQYRGKRMDAGAEIQPEKSRCCPAEGEKLPEDYLCVMEIYVKKEGYFIRDRKKRLLAMTFPLIYKRESGAPGEGYVCFCNRNYGSSLQEAMNALERNLPGHRFIQEPLRLGYELKRNLF